MTEHQTAACGEVILRYCPHIGENVVLLCKRGDGPDTFSCLRAEHCPMRREVSCIGSEAPARRTNKEE